MIKSFASLPIVLVLCTPAAAQSNADILNAIQGLNTRLDGMQKQIDQLKGGQGAATGAPAPASVSAPAPVTPPKAIPGWIVDAMPFVDTGTSVRLFRFTLPSAPTKFGAHNVVEQVDQNVWHKGSAKMNIYSGGEYAFTMKFILDDTTQRCFAIFDVNGTKVIDKQELALYQTGTIVFNGSMNLDVGNYDVGYQIGCRSPNYLKRWWDQSYDIEIMGPDDNSPRQFAAKELFTLKAKQ